MSEETKTELKLPKNYKRPSIEEFTGPGHGYKAEDYEGFFQLHEEHLAAAYASGELTDEMFDADMRLSKQIEDEMIDADGDGLPDVLHIKSQVRSLATRTLRARAPQKHRFKQYLFGNPSLRLVRKRALRVPAAQVRAGLDELIAKEEAGLLSVHAPNGARINLVALKEGQVVMAQLPPAPPLPNKPLDSVANDTPAGENMPQHLGGTFAGDPIAAQTAATMAAGKAEEAEKKQPTDLGDGADPLDTAGAPMVTDDTPGTSVSTELEQPPMGVDGNTAPIQIQLPQDTEASVEAPPAADPLAATTEAALAPAINAGSDEAPVTDEVREPPKEEPSKAEASSKKSGKKGGHK